MGGNLASPMFVLCVNFLIPYYLNFVFSSDNCFLSSLVLHSIQVRQRSRASALPQWSSGGGRRALTLLTQEAPPGWSWTENAAATVAITKDAARRPSSFTGGYLPLSLPLSLEAAAVEWWLVGGDAMAA